MTTRVEPDGPSPGVVPTTTAPRVTSPPARPFKEVMNAGAAAVVTGAEQAVRQLPGGPILAAAFRSGHPVDTYSSASSAALPEGPGGSASSLEVGSSAAGPATQPLLGEASDRTLYYLQLQQQIANETQAYTALSNVLKARHDAIKNAIGNIR